MEAPHSEASKLLEAALEQMDGIIQGAKYDIPNYAEFQSGGGNNNNNGVNNNHAVDAGAPRVASADRHRGAKRDLSEALGTLRSVIVSADVENSAALASDADRETVRFLARWIHNNPAPSARNGGSGGGGIDEDEAFRLEEKAARAESERDAATLRANMAEERLLRQEARMADLEQLLAAKKELLRKTEQALERERAARRRMEGDNPHFSEVAHLKGRCAELEVENQELRAICGGNRTPKYLPLSPSSRARESSSHRRSSPMDSSPDEEPPTAVGDDVEAVSPSAAHDGTAAPSRPVRGFKKIFGKIRRSNSGGHLEEEKRPETPEFRRGGFRATAGGRLGHPSERRREPSAVAKTARPVSEWNVDTICTWLECLGLGGYCGEVKKTIGTGAQLAAMGFADLESKLNVRHYLHRKKLYLALNARQNPQRADPEGGLDFHWVLRWLDDVGLPQYKDAFLEARVDGRVLNMMTTDDLFLLKVSNQLHHLSLRRGIQVLRANSFDPDCLTRRAVPEETTSPAAVALWTNHRVMEWLKQVDLSEYAPNLRGSGVHGALLVLEPRFGDAVLAALLSIPAAKTLLRRHLSLHFKELVGGDVMRDKRAAEQEPGFVPVTPTSKARPSKQAGGGQFTLKRKKSKANFDYGDLLCPFEDASKNA